MNQLNMLFAVISANRYREPWVIRALTSGLYPLSHVELALLEGAEGATPRAHSAWQDNSGITAVMTGGSEDLAKDLFQDGDLLNVVPIIAFDLEIVGIREVATTQSGDEVQIVPRVAFTFSKVTTVPVSLNTDWDNVVITPRIAFTLTKE